MATKKRHGLAPRRHRHVDAQECKCHRVLHVPAVGKRRLVWRTESGAEPTEPIRREEC